MLEELEKDKKRKKIVISGLLEKSRAKKSEVELWMDKNLGIKVTLAKTWLICGEHRRIGVEFESIESKKMIIQL